ncbi:hypothetical protein BFJ72_g132 [Fusarium proliferatum]|uniref:DAPG hydrolase PhiG domain-containing protein n=1 Tax=Gibberella intermedia TaxID=948311 RepID=A0A420UAF4_GIBIN|nr:hypothetical protein BFJ72_g132 [Fusarium proliferatum]
MKFQLVPILAFASPCLAQVAANPPEEKHYSPVPLNTLSENSTSVNVAPYQSNTSLYYLGYKDEDWSRPFVKYWKPAVKQISDEVQKGITESPHASKLVFSPQEAPHYLTQPGYLQLENGWAVSDDNKLMIAIRTDMGNGTVKYKLWNPVAHQYAYRMPNAIDWSNKTLPERYIGSYSWIDEFIGNFATKLTVNFVDPASIGFNISAFASQGIETIVTAHITGSGHTTNVTGNSYLMHQIRRKDDGQRELRSRFFLDIFGDTQGHDLGVHCAVEMSLAYGEGEHFGKCGNWPSRMDRGVEIGLAVDEQRDDISNMLVPSKWSRTEPQRVEESNQSPEGGIKYFWDGFRSRRKSRDIEVPTPIFLESRTPEAQAQPPLASELIVLRNTTTHAPNITLNRHHKVDRGHLYMVASFGILLQIGVLVYFGFITYYPTLKFKKNNKQVLGYAFPFAAAGTVLLVLGMLLSAHVVNRSTTEERYEPAQGREIRMIWLQQKQTVTDQVFGSFALYPRRSPQAITTSKRNSTTDFNRRRESESSLDPLFNETSSTSDQSHETQNAASSYDSESVPAFTLTVFATLVCLAGFIIQFIGLRAMHWSAAVGQLIAVIIMTILRAIVRLGFIAPLKYSNLRDRFELDGLALALGDPKLGPDSGPMNDDHNFDFDQGDKPNPGELSVERRGNEAQEILEKRRHLAQLAGWGGPASREANSLAEAIEVTMNTLCPWEASEPPTWSWTIQVDTRAKNEDPKTFPVSLHLKHLKGQWKARIDELDSVLSLWLASIDKERELASTTSKTKRLGDDDEWYRKKSSQTRGGLVLLGERTKYLEQAFEWWLPADAPKPLEINESEIKEQYEEAWRVVGTKFREGYYKSSLTESSDEEEEREQTNVGDSDEVDDEDEESSFDSQTVKPATFFSISSNDSLEHLFARHIFHAFVWAAVSRMEAPIDQRSEMEVAGTVIPGEWNNIRLRGTILARLVGSIGRSGLMDLNQAYLTLIPPLHAYARLGELDCVVEIMLGQDSTP